MNFRYCSKWIIIVPMYEIKVNVFFVFICMSIAIGDHMKEGDVIILDITNSMNYS